MVGALIRLGDFTRFRVYLNSLLRYLSSIPYALSPLAIDERAPLDTTPQLD